MNLQEKWSCMHRNAVLGTRSLVCSDCGQRLTDARFLHHITPPSVWLRDASTPPTGTQQPAARSETAWWEHQNEQREQWPEEWNLSDMSDPQIFK